MARNIFQIDLPANHQLDDQAIHNWFEQHNFTEAVFSNGIYEVTTFSGGQRLYDRLLKLNPGFTAYYKAVFGLCPFDTLFS